MFYSMDSTLLTAKQVLDKIGPISCKPKFVVIMEGEIKGVVDGADFPTLYDIVDKYIPTLDQE